MRLRQTKLGHDPSSGGEPRDQGFLADALEFEKTRCLHCTDGAMDGLAR